MSDYHVLVVDDEPDIRDVVSILLQSNGYKTSAAENAAKAIELLKNEAFDLIIMDIMMPGMNGIDALKEIRRFSIVPALFLTAKTTDQDRIDAYGSGGDDYLLKPFSQNELLLKVSSLIRRYREYSPKENGRLKPEVYLDEENRTVVKNGHAVELTDKEFEILSYFFKNRGEAVDAHTLYSEVWHEKYLPSAANTVMVHILNLRKKLEDDPSQPKFIRTVWGKGYQIDK